MNDPDRRRWSNGFDDDAIFADIVAHLNDDGPDEQAVATPAAEDEATHAEATDTTAEDSAANSKAEPTSEPTDLSPADRPHARPSPWPINPPPWLPPRNDPADDQEANPQADPTPQPWRADEVDDDFEDHFEPPPVSPLPAGDLQFWGIIIGMCGGPLLLLYLVLFNRDASSYWILIAIAMSVGGFALLVSRMPGHHEDDDDGARL